MRYRLTSFLLFMFTARSGGRSCKWPRRRGVPHLRLTPHVIEEGRYERWHLWVEIARTIDDADIGQLGLRLARQEPQDLLTQCGGGHRGVEHLEHGDAHPGEHRMPTAFGRDFERRQPGFLGQL